MKNIKLIVIYCLLSFLVLGEHLFAANYYLDKDCSYDSLLEQIEAFLNSGSNIGQQPELMIEQAKTAPIYSTPRSCFTIIPSTTSIDNMSISPRNLKIVERVVGEYLKADSKKRVWKVNNQEVSLIFAIEDQESMTAVVNIHRQFTLDYDFPEEVPILRGKHLWLDQNKNRISKSALSAVYLEISNWRSILTDYIEESQDCYEQLKVQVSMKTKNKPDVIILIEDERGNFVPPQIIQSDDQIEQESYQSVDQLACWADQTENVDEVSRKVKASKYNRTNAYNYANKYSSNTTKACRSGSTTVQDSKYYNTSSYRWYTCNDCANFVSQSVNSGGIPKDNTWTGNKTSTSSTWSSVSSLVNYMVNTKKYWQTTDLKGCLAGYPFKMTSYSHIMLMVYNDGKSQTYTAHTSDRLKYKWNGGSSVAYYKVVY